MSETTDEEIRDRYLMPDKPTITNVARMLGISYARASKAIRPVTRTPSSGGKRKNHVGGGESKNGAGPVRKEEEQKPYVPPQGKVHKRSTKRRMGL